MKFLIVEDEILIQQSLKKLLEKKGHLVDVTSMGIDAINFIKVNDYDKIICDLMLKDITGFDIIEDSKNKYSSLEIAKKFIIITAYSSPQVLEHASKYNCLLINKPFNNLLETIEIFIRNLDE